MTTYFGPNGIYIPRNVDPPFGADDLPTLLGFLDRQRATFAWKTSGLDLAALSATHPPSAMTLGGMLKHLARFEDDMVAEWLLGEDQIAPWNDIDWATDPAWDWRTGATEAPDLLYGRWQDAVNRSQAAFARVLATNGEGRHPEAPTLTYILINMIEEYARHNGHADLIRESIDGLVGHDPPSFA
jgi:hypothetical protein